MLKLYLINLINSSINNKSAIDTNVIQIILTYLPMDPAPLPKYYKKLDNAVGFRGPYKDKFDLYICSCSYSGLYLDFDRHMEFDCSDRKRYCFDCGQNCDSKTQLLDHKKNTCRFSYYPCVFCNKDMYRGNVSFHYAFCPNSFYCRICENRYSKEIENWHQKFHCLLKISNLEMQSCKTL